MPGLLSSRLWLKARLHADLGGPPGVCPVSSLSQVLLPPHPPPVHQQLSRWNFSLTNSKDFVKSALVLHICRQEWFSHRRAQRPGRSVETGPRVQTRLCWYLQGLRCPSATLPPAALGAASGSAPGSESRLATRGGTGRGGPPAAWFPWAFSVRHVRGRQGQGQGATPWPCVSFPGVVAFALRLPN